MSAPSALAAAVGDRYRLDRELGQGGMRCVCQPEGLRTHEAGIREPGGVSTVRLPWRSATATRIAVRNPNLLLCSRAVNGTGCWRWDSNPQGLAPNGLRFHRVCRFRHASTTSAANHGSRKARTRGGRAHCRPLEHCSSADGWSRHLPLRPGAIDCTSPVGGQVARPSGAPAGLVLALPIRVSSCN